MDHLIVQVHRVIDIFKHNASGWAQALFLFDNASSHQKQAADVISARKMVKGMHLIDFFLHTLLTARPAPKRGWTHHPDGSPMCPSVLPNSTVQSFYFPNDHPATPRWFKGMEEIICERGLWPKNGL